jgi:hypothetical protein
LPPTLTGIHFTHTRTDDRALGRFLALAPTGWRFMALSRLLPGMTDEGLLRNLRTYGSTMVQLHLSEARKLSEDGRDLLLDRAIRSLPHLTHLQIRGPHCSNAYVAAFRAGTRSDPDRYPVRSLLSRLPANLSTLDIAGCPLIRPEAVVSLVGRDVLPGLKTLKVGMKEARLVPFEDALGGAHGFCGRWIGRRPRRSPWPTSARTSASSGSPSTGDSRFGRGEARRFMESLLKARGGAYLHCTFTRHPTRSRDAIQMAALLQCFRRV